MRFDDTSSSMEAEQIRQLCVGWGLDGEMTALILRSHGRDRARHVPSVDINEDLRGYVLRKLATWEDIFDGPIR